MTTPDDQRLAELERKQGDSPDQFDAWIRRVDALTGSGITIQFHPGYQVTATWTSPGSPTPDTYGPAPVAEVLDHAEDSRARRAGLIQWLATSPEQTARHLTDAEIQDLLPHVPDDNARRVLTAILREHAGSRREDHLARSQPPTSPLTLTPDTRPPRCEPSQAATDQAPRVPHPVQQP
jgi:hypothetical protein